MSLIESAKENNVIELKRLIQNGANVNAVDGFCRTALWYAANRGHVECATALLDAKADVDKADNDGVTPLHWASINGRVECVRLLIHHKANVNALNKYGYSPLHKASLNGHLACVQILVAAGAERDVPDYVGYTPLAWAIERNYPHIAEFLLHSGAKMENVKPSIGIPDWMKLLVLKRENAIRSTLTLKGALGKRFKIPGPEAAFLKGRPPKDIVSLVGLYVWATRLDPKWGEDDLKKMKK